LFHVGYLKPKVRVLRTIPENMENNSVKGFERFSISFEYSDFELSIYWAQIKIEERLEYQN